MPADSISPLQKNDGPAIAMRKQDHIKTASWGNTAAAKAYRQKQAALLAQGDFRGAQQMDIDNVRALFGNAYDDAINQMVKYTEDLGF